MRELLKELRDLLVFEREREENVDMNTWRINEILPRIDAALSAPEPDVRDVEKSLYDLYMSFALKVFPDDQYRYYAEQELHKKAAALIEPSVPRKVLCEVYDRGYQAGLCDKTQDYYFSAIAAKHGVKVR